MKRLLRHLTAWFVLTFTCTWATNSEDIYLIEGDSMVPFIKNGNTVVIDRSVKFESLKIGDVIIFTARVNTQYGTGRQNYIQQPVAHRIIKKKGSTFITKGDNNPFIDISVCTKSNYIGKVVEIY